MTKTSGEAVRIESHIKIIDYVGAWVQLESGEWINVADLHDHLNDSITEQNLESAVKVAQES